MFLRFERKMVVSSEDNPVSDDNIEVLISEDSMLQFIFEVERIWNVVNSMTGLEFGILKPMCPSASQEVGHWLKLSREIIPFAYVTPTGETIAIYRMDQDGHHDVRLKFYTAALLITRYLNCVIEQLEIDASDRVGQVKEILKKLHSLLLSFVKDLDSLMISRTKQDMSLTVSRIKMLTNSVDQAFSVCKLYLPARGLMVTVTEGELLCSVLGLGPKLTKKIRRMKDDRRLQMSPFCFIKKVMEDKMENMLLKKTDTLESGLKSSLSSLGFSQEMSQEIVQNISSINDTNHSPIYWAKEYLGNLFSTHPLLRMLSFFASCSDKEMNRWFHAEAEQHAAEEGQTIQLHFQMIKVGTDEDNLDLTSDLINDMFERDGHTLLFHGAKHAVSIDLILRRGILLSHGRRRQDFSHKDGFYLSDHFKAAKKLATRKGNRPNAVIVYRVPDHLLAFGETAGLDLNEDRSMWSRVVRYHRSGCKVEHDVPDTANLYHRSFIKGPVCRIGYCKKREGILPTIKINRRKEALQYCIRSEKLAFSVSSCVVGIVIYN